MKIIKIFSCILLVSMLCSCGLFLRDADDTVQPSVPSESDPIGTVPDETTTTIAETQTDVDVTEDTTTETSATLPPITEAETTVPETTEAEPTEPIVTEPSVTPVDPPVGSYRPKALMYHLILEEVYGPYENLFVRPSEFELHLTILDELGYEYLFAEEWRVTERPSVVITLDDGYEDNYTEMFPILKAHGAKATVFIVTDLIGTDGYMTRDMIREMSESGLVSFQCHTAHHRDLSYQSADALRADFDSSCAIIKDITGKDVRALAYPAGSFNDTVLAVAGEYFDFAYTTKSPSSTPDYTNLTVPRYYIARGYGRSTFTSFVKY